MAFKLTEYLGLSSARPAREADSASLKRNELDPHGVKLSTAQVKKSLELMPRVYNSADALREMSGDRQRDLRASWHHDLTRSVTALLGAPEPGTEATFEHADRIQGREVAKDLLRQLEGASHALGHSEENLKLIAEANRHLDSDLYALAARPKPEAKPTGRALPDWLRVADSPPEPRVESRNPAPRVTADTFHVNPTAQAEVVPVLSAKVEAHPVDLLRRPLVIHGYTAQVIASETHRISSAEGADAVAGRVASAMGHNDKLLASCGPEFNTAAAVPFHMTLRQQALGVLDALLSRTLDDVSRRNTEQTRSAVQADFETLQAWAEALKSDKKPLALSTEALKAALPKLREVLARKADFGPVVKGVHEDTQSHPLDRADPGDPAKLSEHRSTRQEALGLINQILRDVRPVLDSAASRGTSQAMYLMQQDLQFIPNALADARPREVAVPSPAAPPRPLASPARADAGDRAAPARTLKLAEKGVAPEYIGRTLGDPALGARLAKVEPKDGGAWSANLQSLAMLVDDSLSTPDYRTLGPKSMRNENGPKKMPESRLEYRNRQFSSEVEGRSAQRREEARALMRADVEKASQSADPEKAIQKVLVDTFLKQIGVDPAQAKGWKPTGEAIRTAIQQELVAPLRSLNENVMRAAGHRPETRPELARVVEQITQHVVEGDYADWRRNNPASKKQLEVYSEDQRKAWHTPLAIASDGGLTTREETGNELMWVTKIGGPSHGFDRNIECLMPLLANDRTTPIIVDDPRWPHNGAARAYLRALETPEGKPILYLEPRQRDFPHSDQVSSVSDSSLEQALVKHAIAKADAMGVPLSLSPHLGDIARRLGASYDRTWDRYVLQPSGGVFEASDTLSKDHDWPQQSKQTTSHLERLIVRGASAQVSAKPEPREPPHTDPRMRDVWTLAKQHPNRVFGTRAGERAGNWVAERMKQIGLQPGNGESFFQPFDVTIKGDPIHGRNVVGLLKGTDPTLAAETVLVAAHYDSQKGTTEGANDNATGVAGVLSVAEAMAKNPPKRSVLFITFDGEETGRSGSRAYVANPLRPIEKTSLLVNMDELAQVHLESGPRSDFFYWTTRDAHAPAVMDKAAASFKDGKLIKGYPEQDPDAQFFTTDAEFLFRQGVPTVNFLAGREFRNHSSDDTVEVLVPERMASYTKLAADVTSAGANTPNSLEEMGIRPGGVLPTYPLIRARKVLSLRIPAEESAFHDTMRSRLPDYRSALRTLVRDIETPTTAERGGFTWADLLKGQPLLSEPVLNRARVLLSERVKSLREIPKGEVALRQKEVQKLRVLAGVVDVLQGGIYVDRIPSKAKDYYMQQLPDRLGDLIRGAERLGFTQGVIGPIPRSDARIFSARVSARSAVEVARESMGGLSDALGQSAQAVIDPRSSAAQGESQVRRSDLSLIEDRIAAEARKTSPDNAGPTRQAELADMAFRTTAMGFRGNTTDRWLSSFVGRHQFSNFPDFVASIPVTPETRATLDKSAHRLETALEELATRPSNDPAGSKEKTELSQAILQFSQHLGSMAFGSNLRLETLDDLVRVERAQLDAAAQAHRRSLDVQTLQGKPAAAADSRLVALRSFVDATLQLRDLFEEGSRLRDSATLTEVNTRIQAAREAAAQLKDVPGIAEELDFWSGWVKPYADLEASLPASAKPQGLTELQRQAKQATSTLRRREDSIMGTYRVEDAFDRLSKGNPRDWDALADAVNDLARSNRGLRSDSLDEIRALERKAQELKPLPGPELYLQRPNKGAPPVLSATDVPTPAARRIKPEWLGNAKLVLPSKWGSDMTSALEEPIAVDVNEPTRARAQFEVWAPGLTDRHNSDAWRQLNVEVHFRQGDGAFETRHVETSGRSGNNAVYGFDLKDLAPKSGEKGDVEFYFTVNGEPLKASNGAAYRASFTARS
jgi:hypothetical protein